MKVPLSLIMLVTLVSCAQFAFTELESGPIFVGLSQLEEVEEQEALAKQEKIHERALEIYRDHGRRARRLRNSSIERRKHSRQVPQDKSKNL